jgi:lysozyme family protein
VNPAFVLALDRVLDIEGRVRSSDPDDPGGDTYWGISRNRWPNWEGWSQLAYGAGARQMEPVVQAFYEEHFWNRLTCDEIEDAAVQYELLESSINVGVGTASRWLQRALNALNVGQRLWDDVTEDGKVGKRTLEAFRACAHRGRADALLVLLNCQQGSYYLDLTRSHPPMKKWLRGWIDRRVKL